MDPGTLLAGRYRIDAELASGGMGVVYSATQLPLGRPVAVKVLRRDLLKHGTFLARLRREAQTAATLKHPHVVDVTDLVLEEDLAFLVMELLAGESFGAHIAQAAPVTEEVVLQVGMEALAALHAAHGVGLVHRDVKPDNIFLAKVNGGGFTTKLLDFGLVKINDAGDDRLTADNAVLGTWQYMSPEQARGEQADVRSDVYSLGACLYYALTKKRPYQAAKLDAPMFALSEVAPPDVATLRPEVSPELAAVVHRALDKDRARRWQTAADMRNALAAIRTRPRSARTLEEPTLESASFGARRPEETLSREEVATTLGKEDKESSDIRDALPTVFDPLRSAVAYEPTLDVSAPRRPASRDVSVELSSHHLVTEEPKIEASVESVELSPIAPGLRHEDEPAGWPAPAKARIEPLSRPHERRASFTMSRWRWIAVVGVIVFVSGLAFGHLFSK